LTLLFLGATLNMKIEYDDNKNRTNILQRNISFDDVIDFEFHTAHIILDVRNAYGEDRYVATGFLKDRLHVLCFKKIHGGIRVISFRKANAREVKHYEKSKATNK
jgi:uncharacterized DUF497 family protein